MAVDTITEVQPLDIIKETVTNQETQHAKNVANAKARIKQPILNEQKRQEDEEERLRLANLELTRTVEFKQNRRYPIKDRRLPITETTREVEKPKSEEQSEKLSPPRKYTSIDLTGSIPSIGSVNGFDEKENSEGRIILPPLGDKQILEVPGRLGRIYFKKFNPTESELATINNFANNNAIPIEGDFFVSRVNKNEELGNLENEGYEIVSPAQLRRA